MKLFVLVSKFSYQHRLYHLLGMKLNKIENKYAKYNHKWAYGYVGSCWHMLPSHAPLKSESSAKMSMK